MVSILTALHNGSGNTSWHILPVLVHNLLNLGVTSILASLLEASFLPVRSSLKILLMPWHFSGVAAMGEAAKPIKVIVTGVASASLLDSRLKNSLLPVAL